MVLQRRWLHPFFSSILFINFSATVFASNLPCTLVVVSCGRWSGQTKCCDGYTKHYTTCNTQWAIYDCQPAAAAHYVMCPRAAHVHAFNPKPTAIFPWQTHVAHHGHPVPKTAPANSTEKLPSCYRGSCTNPPSFCWCLLGRMLKCRCGAPCVAGSGPHTSKTGRDTRARPN